MIEAQAADIVRLLEDIREALWGIMGQIIIVFVAWAVWPRRES